MLFRFDEVDKEYGGQRILSGITAQANPGDHIGLIGRNGCGKTTLLSLASGRLEPDSGMVYRKADLQAASVEQSPRLDPKRTVRAEALSVFEDLKMVEDRLRALEARMSASGSIEPGLASEYEKLRLRFELEGGYDREARTLSVLHGVGFQGRAEEMPCGQLSGGQVSRLCLAKALLQPSDVLLLDEPTNHLDLEGVLWLTDYLRSLKEAFIVVSHDRRFLDRVCEMTWEIEDCRLRSYPENFTGSRRLKEKEQERADKEYRRQLEWKARTEDFIRRNIAGQKTRQAQSRARKLRKTHWIEKPAGPTAKPIIQVREADRGGAVSLKMESADFGYPSVVLVREVSLEIRRGERIALLGSNGSGKSTLLRTLVGEVSLLNGALEWGYRTAPAYFSQDPDLGSGDRTIFDCLRDLDNRSSDEEIHAFAARFLFRGDEVFKKLSELSGGERSRLALACLLYHPTNVLLLDEPTNHLDIPGREALESALENYRGTLLVVSHDLYFVEKVTDRVLYIDGKKLVGFDSVDVMLDSIRSADRRQEDFSEPHEKPAIRQPKPGSEETLSKNERRRRELRLVELEERIEDLEARKERALQALSSQQDFGRLTELSLEHQSLEEDLARLYELWEQTARELGG